MSENEPKAEPTPKRVMVVGNKRQIVETLLLSGKGTGVRKEVVPVLNDAPMMEAMRAMLRNQHYGRVTIGRKNAGSKRAKRNAIAKASRKRNRR